MGMPEIEIILNFFEMYYETKKLYYNSGIPIITAKFIFDFDKFARERGYDTFGMLRKFSEVQNNILGTEDNPVELELEPNLTEKCIKWGAYFRYHQLCKIFNREPVGFVKENEVF